MNAEPMTLFGEEPVPWWQHSTLPVTSDTPGRTHLQAGEAEPEHGLAASVRCAVCHQPIGANFRSGIQGFLERSGHPFHTDDELAPHREQMERESRVLVAIVLMDLFAEALG